MKKYLVMWHMLKFTTWSWISELACSLFWDWQAYVKG